MGGRGGRAIALLMLGLALAGPLRAAGDELLLVAPGELDQLPQLSGVSPVETPARSSIGRRVRGGAGGTPHAPRMMRISVPTSSVFQLRSAVSTGRLVRRASARHARSPGDRPCLRVSGFRRAVSRA